VIENAASLHDLQGARDFRPFSSMNLQRLALLAASLSGALAVALGAFGAHALRSALDEHALATWHTAVDYQFWHALALLALGLLARERTDVMLRFSTLAFIAGSVLFCGSLYALACGGPRLLGAVTPLGGVLFISGWIAIGLHAWRMARA
jgi:uncharacterized membrane protein YgdD (TMEM256/DUF423 family)